MGRRPNWGAGAAAFGRSVGDYAQRRRMEQMRQAEIERREQAQADLWERQDIRYGQQQADRRAFREEGWAHDIEQATMKSLYADDAALKADPFYTVPLDDVYDLQPGSESFGAPQTSFGPAMTDLVEGQRLGVLPHRSDYLGARSADRGTQAEQLQADLEQARKGMIYKRNREDRITDEIAREGRGLQRTKDSELRGVDRTRFTEGLTNKEWDRRNKVTAKAAADRATASAKPAALTTEQAISATVNAEEEWMLGDTFKDEVAAAANRMFELGADNNQTTWDKAEQLVKDNWTRELYMGGEEYDPATGQFYNPMTHEPVADTSTGFWTDVDPGMKVLDGLDKKSKIRAGLPAGMPITLGDYVNERIRPAIEAKTTTLDKVKGWVKDAGVPMVDFMAEWDKQVADPETERETLAQKAGRLKAEEDARAASVVEGALPVVGDTRTLSSGKVITFTGGDPAVPTNWK